MQERLRGLVNKVSGKWSGLEKVQKIRLMSAGAALVVTLGVAQYFAVKSQMVTLVDGLDYMTISEMKTALDDLGMTNVVTRDGSGIQIREKDYNMAKINLAVQDIPSSGMFTYEDALRFSNMDTTESIKKQNFRRAKESELAQALTIFSGVESAKVFLEVPDENDNLIDTNRQVLASVLLRTNGEMDKAVAAAIVRFISRSVQGLTMDNIEIANQDGMIFSGTLMKLDIIKNDINGSEHDIEQQR